MSLTALNSTQTPGMTDEGRWPWLPIVMLHRIVDRVPAPNPFDLCMSVDGLDRTIRLLRRQRRRIVTLGDAVEAFSRGEDVNGLACLTFDDGYRDFLTHALPVLERNQAPATVFLVSDQLGGWNLWDAGNDAIGPAPLLSLPEVRELATKGIEFGSHSSTHPHIANLPLDQRDAEIAGSKRNLESMLEREVSLFAYPHIDQDEDAQQRVAQAGYRAAVGGEQPEHSRFLLHRISLSRLDGLSFRVRSQGWRYRAQRFGALRASKNHVQALIGGVRS